MAFRRALTTTLLVHVFLFAHSAGSVEFICKDGSALTCRDGSIPVLREDPFGREDLRVGSLCPVSCNIYKNTCDRTTAPTCIYPDPSVRKPRAACACRPGYKASNAPNGDTKKHWRLPVVGQEHRVWVAEGVKCDALCGGYGAQSCTEVTMLGRDCVGDGTSAGSGVGDGIHYPAGGGSNDTIPKPYRLNASSTDAYHRTTRVSPDDVPVESSSSSAPYGEAQSSSVDAYSPDSSGDASSPWDIPDHFGSALPSSSEESSAQGGNMPQPFEVPSDNDQPQRRGDTAATWKLEAQRQAWTIFQDDWAWLMDKLTGRRDEFRMNERPGLCQDILTWVVRGCTRGIEIQNSNCKLDQGADPRCLTYSLDTQCCEGYKRENRYGWCNGDWSNLASQQRRSQLQETCAIVTPVGRSAVDVYISLGMVEQLLQVMKEGEQEPALVAEVTVVEGKWGGWARGLGQLADGRVDEALAALADIKPKVSDYGQDRVAWSQALEPVIADEIDDFMSKAIHTAYDVYVIMRERELMISLLKGQQVGKSLDSIKSVSEKYAIESVQPFLPHVFAGFEKVQDQASMDAALKDYKASIGVSQMLNVARSWALVVRVNRVLAG